MPKPSSLVCIFRPFPAKLLQERLTFYLFTCSKSDPSSRRCRSRKSSERSESRPAAGSEESPGSQRQQEPTQARLELASAHVLHSARLGRARGSEEDRLVPHGSVSPPLILLLAYCEKTTDIRLVSSFHIITLKNTNSGSTAAALKRVFTSRLVSASNIDRSVKDLQRCTASLTRYRMVVKEEMDSSIKRMKQTFAELQSWCVNISKHLSVAVELNLVSL